MSQLPTHNTNGHHHHHHHHHHHRHPAHHHALHKQLVGVYSESGKLDAVLMHRPGREIERLTPENKDILLFDNIPNIDETHRSHDAFADALRKENVQVFYVLDLLRETLEHSPQARTMLIDGIVDHSDLSNKEVSSALSQFLHSLTPTQLAHTVVEGLLCTEEELSHSGSLKSILLKARSLKDEFLIPPLPNLLFTRDSFSIIEKNVFIWRMAKPARRNEPLIMRVIFTFHTFHEHLSLRGIHVVDWETHTDSTATVEGGDVAYIGHGTLLIGNGERTNRAGIEGIERTGLFRRVIAIELPENRDYMHLDTVMSSVGRHSFICHSHLAQQLTVYTVQTPREEGAKTEWLSHGKDVRKALRHLLSDVELKFYDAADEATSIAEQHQCRDNMLCLGNQTVITYAGGDPINGIINQLEHDRQHPCHVETFPSKGLIEGCGGAHCMTNALHRLEN
ncbi:unnamed protein product [Rotaria sp. Silwood1]|nr:unnamed protein product [Rotaria sp. Silwood1]